MTTIAHILTYKRLRILIILPVIASLLAGCPWLKKSKSEEEEAEGASELRMLFNAECESSTCFIDTGPTYDNNSNVSQIVCEMGDDTFIDVAQLELNFDYMYDAPGSYAITCIVTNDDGLTDTQTISVLVTGLFADAGPDVLVPERQSVVLDGSGSVDESGNGLTYQWTKLTGPAGFFLDDSTVESPTFTAPSVETTTVFIYSLRVDNGIEDPDTDTVSITVQETDLTDLPQ